MTSIQRTRRATFALAAVAAASATVVLNSNFASAASGSWTGAATPDINWPTAGNWDTVPGVANGTFVNIDIATFADATNGDDVTVDLNRNIGGMVFNTTAPVSGFAIGTLAASGGNTLYLTGGGMIDVLATNASTSSPIIHAPVVIMGNSYTMRNNSTTTAAGLKFSSGFNGGTSGALTVTLGGSNTVNVTTANNHVLGPIEDGTASSLSVVKEGTGVWELRPTFGANTYSGDTVINGGLLRLMSTVGSMSPNSNYVVNNGGTLRPNFNGVTGKSIKINSGGSFQSNADATITNFNATNGPSVWLNMVNTTGPYATGSVVKFTGETPGQGGLRLSLQDATGKITYRKAIDLGNVMRPFEIAASTTNATSGDPDLQLDQPISGAGGIIKTGPGTMKFNDALNSFAGTLEIQQGAVRFNSPDALTSKPPVLITGGEMDVSTNQQTIGLLNLNSGTISSSSSGGGVVRATSVTMTVPGGQTALASVEVGDSTGPTAVSKFGTGTATLTKANTYTGGTTVSDGVLRVGVEGTVANGNVTVNGGTLAVSSGRTAPLKVAALSIGGGRVDLNDNDMIVTSGSSSTVRTQIAAARNGGSWNGTGITSSAARNATPKNTTLGVLTGAEFFTAQGSGALFGGQTVNATDVLVKYTYYGDADFNGQVNFDDYSRTDAGFNNNRSGWLNGDFDGNNIVNFDDYSLLDLSFNTQSGTLIRAMDWLEGEDRSMRGMDDPALQKVVEHYQQFGNGYATSFLQAVPEPTSTLVFAGVQALACMRRRHRAR